MILLANPKMRDALLILAIAAFSAACGSSRPIKYYTLDVPAESAVDLSPQFPISILVARVTAAHLYRDDRLVYGTGAFQLGTYEYQRWTEPPVDMIQDSLIAALRATHRYRSVSAIASNLRGNYIVRAHLTALDEIDKPQLAARFSLDAELYDPRAGAALWSASYTHDEPVAGKKVPDVIEALDRNVKVGMAQLATELGQYFASLPPHSS